MRTDWTLVGMIGVLGAALALRTWNLDRTSIWADEATSWYQANRDFLDVLAATARDNYPPLHNIILHGVIQTIGDSEIALRAPSVVLGTATVAMIYLLARQLYDGRTGLVSAVLCTGSAMMIWYSQEARMYALLAFCSAFYLHSLVRYLFRPGWVRGTIHVLAGLALLHSHVYGLFTFAGAGLAVLIAGSLRPGLFAVRLPHWIGLQVLIGLGFAPWAYILVERWMLLQRGFWIPDPHAGLLWEAAVSLMSGEFGAVALVVFVIAAIVRVVPRTSGRPRHHGENRLISVPLQLEIGWRETLLLATTFLPIAIAVIISLVSQPILFDHYLIGTGVPVLVLAAAGLVSLGRNTVAILAIVALLMGTGAPSVAFTLTERPRHDWRSAVTFYKANRTQSPVLVYKHWMAPPVRYYLKSEDVRVRRQTEASLFERLQAGNENLWLFLGDSDHAHLDKIERFIEQHFFVHKRAQYFEARVLHIVPRVVRVPERTDGS